jgi:adenosylcobinamide kinase/adenosylcobinamide-phosphate guanylyltransferase
MSARIAMHRKQRPSSWRVIEEPVRLGATLRAATEAHAVILIDCLTLWTSNCLWPDNVWAAERESFLEALRDCSGRVIIVSNEVGTGIIPANAASRVFVDEQGWLNQSVAAACDEVYLAVAGIGVRIKPA